MKCYPDISDIIARKERGRRALAGLSFWDKLDMLDRLRENAAVFMAPRTTTVDMLSRRNKS